MAIIFLLHIYILWSKLIRHINISATKIICISYDKFYYTQGNKNTPNQRQDRIEYC